MRTLGHIIIHCSETYAHMDTRAKHIRRWHVEERGWSDIGYHFVICRDGEIEKGRDIETPGAHCLGRNHDSIGICMVGGKPDCNFTRQQWSALDWLIDKLIKEHGALQVSGHNTWSPKACPQFNAEAWYNATEETP